MDWKLFGTTFITIFLAELGDKTQLGAMSLASGSNSRMTVWAAACAALVLSTTIAVLIGDQVARLVSPVWINRAAGALFVALGLIMLHKTFG